MIAQSGSAGLGFAKGNLRSRFPIVSFRSRLPTRALHAPLPAALVCRGAAEPLRRTLTILCRQRGPALLDDSHEIPGCGI